METKSRNIAEEAAARTREIMEQAERKELPPAEEPKALLREGEGFVREHPWEAVFGALSCGLLLSRLLPVRALARGLFKGTLGLGWMLFKPLALIYTGAKLWEWAREPRHAPPSTGRSIEGMSQK